MLDNLRTLLKSEKINDLVARLADKNDPKQTIGAEMELALLWGIKQVARIQVDPVLPHSRRVPEARSEDLFNVMSYIEVTTVSDGKLSGELVMRRASQKIVEFANKCRKGSGNDLYFSFGERTTWTGNKYLRKHHVAAQFELTDSMRSDIRDWISSNDFREKPLALQAETIQVTIKDLGYRQKPGFNIFSPLPPLAYDIEDNPLYAALESKYDQLAGVSTSALKVIFIADGGSRLVRRLSERDNLGLHKSGSEIIAHFLRKRDIDLVCVFSPTRPQSQSHNRLPLYWKVTKFEGREKRVSTFGNLEALARALPVPQLDASQARAAQMQGIFSPNKPGSFLASTIGTGYERITMKMSARILQEFLAGKITAEAFRDHTTGTNLFAKWLSDGYVISNARFEGAGIDKDDDYVILEFRRDPSASGFT